MLDYIFNIKNLYIFCLWIWILTLLNFLNLINISLLYSSLFALLFTIYHKIYINKSNSIIQNIFIICFESIILLLNIYLHFYKYKLNLVDIKTINYNLIIFVIYLLYLKLLGLSFYDVYYKILV